MTRIWDRLRRLVRNESGAGLIEYVLLVGLLAIVCFGALKFFGDSTRGSLGKSSSCMTAAENGTPGAC